MPTPNNIPTFLKSPDEESSYVPGSDDLETFRQLLQEAETFQIPSDRDSATHDFQQQIFYHVLGHTKFINRELLSIVEQYKQNLHILTSLDFVSPMTSLRSAEREIDNMSASGIKHAARIAHLQEMVTTQKQRLSELKKHWLSLTAEFRRLTLIIRDKLSKMEQTCVTSIAILSDCEIARKREWQRIEDIKKNYKTQLKYNMYGRRVTWRDLENAKAEFDLLSREISILGREEITSLAELYASIRGRIRITRNEIDALLVEIETRKNESVKENKDLFKRLGRVLVSFLSDRRFGLKAPEHRDIMADESILEAARKELFDYLFAVVQKERRSLHDRRSFADRRNVTTLQYKGKERRNRKDRRTTNRRKIDRSGSS